MTEGASAWLRSALDGVDRDERAFVAALADLLDELGLAALDTAQCRAVAMDSGHDITLAHRDRRASIEIMVTDEIVVSYGAEHEHFARDDAELGRVWPFHEDGHIAQALAFVRYLITGRIELHMWRRPLALKTRSYWINDDGDRELFLRGSTIGPFFGWSSEPEVHRFDFSA